MFINMKPKISLMIHTASHDVFLQNQNINSYFESVVDCLKRQTFKAFEFIYIDTFYEDNKEKFENIIKDCPFQIKHVPIHKNHRYWFDQDCCYISAAKNTGVLYADGDLLITCDDGEYFPDDLLQRYWANYNDKFLMHAFHKRMKTIKTDNGEIVYPIDGDIYINDHRASNVATNPVYRHNYGTWAFAGSSFTLEDALKLNGFNERMDGCKSLEDCDFGTRLQMIGRQFTLDKAGFVYILDHQSYGDAMNCNWESKTEADGQLTTPVSAIEPKKKINNLIAIENYGMCRCAIELIDLRANWNPLTPKHFEIIKRETIKYRNFDPFEEANKSNIEIWLKTPTFDLKKERTELRVSTDWKWNE
jgi:glycosyltransferase involved in cell wall biosynthesis